MPKVSIVSSSCRSGGTERQRFAFETPIERRCLVCNSIFAIYFRYQNNKKYCTVKCRSKSYRVYLGSDGLTIAQRWRVNHPHWDKNYQKNYHRLHRLGTRIDGKKCVVGLLNKRPYPESCEMCGSGKKLVYHHWDNSNLNIGIWICNKCHWAAEGVESGKAQVYIDTKLQVIKESKCHPK